MDHVLPRRLFNSLPRKEGRPNPSYYPSYRPRRRLITVWRTIGALILLTICTVCTLSLLPTEVVEIVRNQKREDSRATSVTKKNAEPAPKVEVSRTQRTRPMTSHEPAVQVFSDSHTPHSSMADLEEEELQNVPASIPSTQNEATNIQSAIVRNGQAGERTGFDVALERVLSLLPDEIHVRELLRPFEGTGAEKLREIGLRVRAFRVFFEAWEALHLVSIDEATYVRDDVLQTLRSHPELATYSSKRLAQTARAYESYRSFLTRLSTLLFPWTAPYFSDHMTLHAQFEKAGRGMVLTAGDDQALYLLTTIRSFRELGCSLPIEIMYLGDNDLSEDYRLELEDLPAVTTRDLSQMVNDEGWELAGWAIKPFAVVFSSFREVIFIDADSVFFRNPASLFSHPAYLRTGALFFKDRLIMPESKKRWLKQVLPKPVSKQVQQSRYWTGESGHMQESGVLVIDKWRHFVALLLVTRMNGPDRDGDEEEGIVGIYDMVYGDKETFWIGWELAGDPDYAFHEGDAGIMGAVQAPKKPRKPRRPKRPKRPKKQQDTNSRRDGNEDDEKEKDEADNTSDEEIVVLEGTASDEESILLEETTILDDSNPAAASAPPAVNYTICAPQLLHLDADGKPLWFNGWLLVNKFATGNLKKQGTFGQFEHYMREPRDVRDPGAWQLKADNVCCLTADEVLDFSVSERETLDMIIRLAKEVTA